MDKSIIYLGIMIIILIFLFFYLNNMLLIRYEGNIENFVDNNESFITKNKLDEIYCKYFNNTFSYDELYKNDAERIINRAVSDWKKTIMLDAGTGCGRHYKYFKNKIGSLIGVDVNENMLKYARLKNEKGKFLKGNLCNENLFNPETFTHICCLNETLYRNNFEDMDKILSNFYFWLKNKGKLVIHIYNRDRLDPGPREYSQYYKDENGRKHSLTYFNTYTHDAHWKDVDENRVKYIEKYILKNGKQKNKETILFLPKNREKIMEKIRNYGFKLVDELSMKELGEDDMSLLIYEKSIFRDK